MSYLKILSCYLCTLVSAIELSAQTPAALRISNVLQSNMVVQRVKPFRVWGTAEPGRQIKVTASWGAADTTIVNGQGKWTATITVIDAVPSNLDLADSAIFPKRTITITDGVSTTVFSNILIGDVWVCSGQSNMSMYMKPNIPFHYGVENYQAEIDSANFPNIRLMTVGSDSLKNLKDTIPQDSILSGTWSKCSPATVGTFSAIAYYFGRDLQRRLKIPIGLIVAAKGSSACQAWTSREVLSGNIALDTTYPNTNLGNLPYYMRPASLYNTIIHPLINLSIKGFIWNQGESNAGPNGRNLYPLLNSEMIKGWRQDFRDTSLPFFFVQLPGEDYNPGNTYRYGLSQFREIQESILKLRGNLGMAVTIDLGDKRTVHSSKKREVGERLAMLVSRKIYFKTGFTYEGPVYASHYFSTNRDIAYVRFAKASIAGGLKVKDNQSIREFFVADSSKRFYPATAEITPDTTIKLTCSAVPKIQYIRYAFTNFPFPNLYNDSLPVRPFRTDTFSDAVMLPLPYTNDSTQFSRGHIVVSQSGADFPVASGASTSVRLLEFDTSGVNQTVQLSDPYPQRRPTFQVLIPDTGATRLTVANNFFNISLTNDKSQLLIGGYDAPVGTSSIMTGTGITRAVNAVAVNGSISRKITAGRDEIHQLGLRAVTGDADSIWTAGSGTNLKSGIMFKKAGASLATQVTNIVTNTRVVSTQNDTIYFSTVDNNANGQFGIYKFTNGKPQAAATPALIINTASSGIGANKSSPYGFAFSPDGNTCYIADDRRTGQGGGIQRWKRTGTGWVLLYTLSTITVTDGFTSTDYGARGLVVDFSDTSAPVIFATTAEPSPNRLIKIKDIGGAASNAVLLSASPDNAFYNSVCFSPVAASSGNSSNRTVFGQSENKINFSDTRKGVNNAASFDVYPNPFGETIYLKFKDVLSSEYAVRISAMDGREVKRIRGLKPLETIDARGWEKGTYFIILYRNEAIIATKKLIKP